MFSGLVVQKILYKIIKKIGKIYLKKKALEETRSPELIARISKGSLLNFYGNTHSQIGQDGILQEIFKKLDIEKGFFCEFGAWDGVYLSNCRKLVEEGWAGVFIEGNEKKFKDLSLRYQSFSGIHCISAFVGAPKRGIIGDPLFMVLEKNNFKSEMKRITKVSSMILNLDEARLPRTGPSVDHLSGILSLDDDSFGDQVSRSLNYWSFGRNTYWEFVTVSRSQSSITVGWIKGRVY